MTGDWREINHPWYESRIINCAFCGQMIARRTFVVSVGARDEHFCTETCGDRALAARGEERGEAD